MSKIMMGIFLAVIIIGCLFSSCVLVSGDFHDVRELILKELRPVDVDTKFQLSFGPSILTIGRLLTHFAKADRKALACLREITHVQVGIYKLDGRWKDGRVEIPAELGKLMVRKGYEPTVKVKNHREATWVLTHIRADRLRAMYIIVLQENELVLVEIHGWLERLIEKALREHRFDRNDFIIT